MSEDGKDISQDYGPVYDWLHEHAVVLGAIAAITAIILFLRWLIGPLLISGRAKRLEADLCNPKIAFETTLNSFYCNRYRRYYRTVWIAADGFKVFYGERLFGRLALVRCLQIALYYTLVFYILSWVLFGQPKVGGITVFDSSVSLPFRIEQTLTMGVALFLIISSWAVVDTIGPSLRNLMLILASKIIRSPARMQSIYPWFRLVEVIMPIIILLGALTSIAKLYTSVPPLFLVFLLLAVMTINSFYATAVITALYLYFLFGGYLNPPYEALLPLGMVLPLANASADFLSVATTRGFLVHIAGGRDGFFRIIGTVVLDLVFAALCLVLLLALMVGAFEAFNAVQPITDIFNWRDYRDVLLKPDWSADDWGILFPLLMMCVTTLIPTAIHVVLGLAAVFSHGSMAKARVRDKIEAAVTDPNWDDGQGQEMDATTAGEIADGYRRDYAWGMVCAGLLIIAIVYALIFIVYALIFLVDLGWAYAYPQG